MSCEFSWNSLLFHYLTLEFSNRTIEIHFKVFLCISLYSASEMFYDSLFILLCIENINWHDTSQSEKIWSIFWILIFYFNYLHLNSFYRRNIIIFEYLVQFVEIVIILLFNLIESIELLLKFISLYFSVFLVVRCFMTIYFFSCT